MANDVIDKVLNELGLKRQERAQLVLSRENDMRSRCPEIKELDRAIARAALKDRDLLPGLLQKRCEAIAQWLGLNALPQDYLEPSPDCPVCGDSGQTEGKLCTCVRNEVARRMFADAGLGDNSPSFEKFNLSLFPNDRLSTSGVPCREQMKFNRDLGIAYSDNFPELQKPNMLFCGKPGRGKTYLMDCIAGRLISRGFWVVRATSYHVNDIMAKAMFDRADPDSLFDCDLLLLDDLGSEPILNKVTISSLFNLFNERTAQRKPFILSTNLTPEEILRRYGDRVFSRITDTRNTRLLEFEGVDLRKC